MDHDKFELNAVSLVCEIVRNIPGQFLSLVFASPLSTRDIDVSPFWHINYRENHKFRILIHAIWTLIISFLKGILRLITKFGKYGFILYGNISDCILVVPSTCGSENEKGKFKTPYIFTTDCDAIFVFGTVKNMGTKAHTDRRYIFHDIFTPMLALLYSGVIAFIRTPCPFYEKSLLFITWISWVFSLQWLQYLFLEKKISKLAEENGVKKIGCIHEMHSYSRVVWLLAARLNIKGYTVQHASFSQTKRWLFPHPKERAIGLATPHFFYVFNEDTFRMLQPSYSGTCFIAGLSARYALWTKVQPSSRPKSGYYLFASTLPFFDNKVVIGAIRNLSKEIGKSSMIRFRLHPAAKIPPLDRLWLFLNSKRGYLQISSGTTLQDDIEGAVVVIGMGTTVLEEALLLNRPVIQLLHPDYSQYLDLGQLEGVTILDYRAFSGTCLQNVRKISIVNTQTRERLGLCNKIVTFERLFSDTSFRDNGAFN